MTTLQTMIQDLCTAGANPQATIQTSLKETGKPAVGCFPLFVPEELVYAAGFLPVGMWGGISAFQKSNQYIQSFACSIMRANLELGMSGAYDFLKAALIPSQCDTLKCVCENFKVAVPKAVSYTHLDVYKRQGERRMPCPSSSSPPCLGCITRPLSSPPPARQTPTHGSPGGGSGERGTGWSCQSASCATMAW